MLLKDLLIEELPRATFGNSRIPAQKYRRVTFAAQRPAQRNAAQRSIAQR
jgi:hypothetical protein